MYDKIRGGNLSRASPLSLLLSSLELSDTNVYAPFIRALALDVIEVCRVGFRFPFGWRGVALGFG